MLYYFILLSDMPKDGTLLQWILGAVAIVVGTLYTSSVVTNKERHKDKDSMHEKVLAEKDRIYTELKTSKDKEIIYLKEEIAENKRKIAKLEESNLSLMTGFKSQLTAVLTTLEQAMLIFKAK